MKKFIAKLFTIICILTLALTFVACDDKTENTSGLIGSFTYSEAIKTNDAGEDLRIYSSEADATNGNMFVTAYPFNTITSAKICYTVDQRLRLKRDFSYNYQYTITLTNAEEWGKDCAQISVVMSGTFTYSGVDGDYYDVVLSNPTQGTFTVYGSTINGEGSIYSWNLNSSPSFIIDVETELKLDKNYQFNRYLAGRTVSVSKVDKEIYDNLFFRDIVNDIAPYSDYQF